MKGFFCLVIGFVFDFVVLGWRLIFLDGSLVFFFYERLGFIVLRFKRVILTVFRKLLWEF